MIEIRPLSSPAGLQELLATQVLQPFLQSWAWGEFQASIGRKIWRLGAYDGEQLVGAALVIEHQLLLGKTYLYCPRGPIAATRPVVDVLLPAIHELGQKEGAMYVKIDLGLFTFPFDPADWASRYSVGTPLQPATTQVLDLMPGAEALLETMHQKTRYNIRLAEKKGVQIRWSEADDDFPIFLDLITRTYSRQGIRLHPAGYYRELWTHLRNAGQAALAIAEWQGRPLAANLILWHGTTATYLHGGSSDTEKNIMAPYLLQWRTIEEAIRRGMKEYDFWGVAPNDDANHKWAGVTRFKKGFGGRVVTFPPALNSILQPQWYQAYRWAKRFRGGVDV